MKRLLFVMNPYAGMRKANKVLAEILSVFSRAGCLATTYMTAGPGDGREFVTAMAHDYDLIVCCGGDGTFNETVSGVLTAGVRVPIGYIPAGSTNDFASSLGLSMDPVQAAKDIMEGKPLSYDVGCFGGRFFSYVASFGAFTRASYATPQSVKNTLGHTAYILEGISELSQIRPEHVRIELYDGTIIDDEFLFGAISNSTSVGGILTIPPGRVDMRDGKFELLLVRAPRDFSEITECIHALQKQTYNCAMVKLLSTPGLKITARSAMDWTLDGEHQPGKEGPVEVENLHHAVDLIVKQ